MVAKFETIMDALEVEEVTKLISNLDIRLDDRKLKLLSSKVMNKAGLANKTLKINGYSRKTLLCAAIIVSVLFVSGAGYYFKIGNYFNSFFTGYNGDDLSVEQQNMLDNRGVLKEASVTGSGYAMQIKAIVGDSSRAYVVFELASDSLETLNKPLKFAGASYKWKDVPQGYEAVWQGVECKQLEDENKEDNKATFVMMLNAPTDGKLTGKDVIIRLTDLCEYEIVNNTEQPLIITKHSWETGLTIDYLDISTNYEVNELAEIDGKTIRLSSVQISPFTVIIKGERDIESIHNLDERNREAVKEFEIDYKNTRVSLEMKNGDIVENVHHLDGGEYWNLSMSEYLMAINWVNYFTSPLTNTENVAAIIVDGERIVLSGN